MFGAWRVRGHAFAEINSIADQVDVVGSPAKMPAQMVDHSFIDADGVITQAGKHLEKKWTGSGW